MRVLLLLIAAIPAWAGLTTVAETLKNPDGTNFAGTIRIQLTNPGSAQPLYNSAGQSLTGFLRTVTVTAGVFSLTLEANSAITPAGTSYGVRFTATSGASWNETWVVPASASPVLVATVRSTTIPTPAVMISPTQISGAGATAGQALVFNGTSYAPASIGASFTASAVIDLAAVPDGTCVLDSTAVTVTGAALGGRPSIGYSALPPEGVHLFAKVTGPNSMKVEVCNLSGASYDPASATYYFGVTQ